MGSHPYGEVGWGPFSVQSLGTSILPLSVSTMQTPGLPPHLLCPFVSFPLGTVTVTLAAPSELISHGVLKDELPVAPHPRAARARARNSGPGTPPRHITFHEMLLWVGVGGCRLRGLFLE